ncbi:hypothetical protein ACFTWF_03235 [Rhodococcus sp. NPDC056960]|uniref:hypothetical protein n=1 Tax=Rhodococcus sp. NPDC056960 TaxID=3345982 RepID=UPI003645F294
MTSESEPVPLAVVIGRNARRLRGSLPMEAVAKNAKRAGLSWNTGRVTDLEKGRVSPTVPTLFALTLALTDATGVDVGIVDLIQSEQPIELTPEWIVTTAALAAWLTGERRAFDGAQYMDALAHYQRHRAPRPEAGLAEERAAKGLNISIEDLGRHAEQLWGRSLAEERDRRAGPEANAQRRGIVTRQLTSEIATAIERSPRGND